MKHRILYACISAMLAAPVLAAEPKLGTALGTSTIEISSTLDETGYELTKYERQVPRIEVYALREGHQTQISVDAATGKVIAVASRSEPIPTADDVLDEDRIRTALQAQGYEVLKYERERGEIEVYAMRDGRQWELKLDPVTGKVIDVEEED